MSGAGGLGAAPYVLLDDARPGGAAARLYRGPVAVVTAVDVEDVQPALDRIRAAVETGLHAAGYLAYEAGAAFVPSARAQGSEDDARDPGFLRSQEHEPLLWFGLFDRYDTVDDVAALLPDPAGAWIGAAQPAIDRATYDAQIARILGLIAAGDIYQANLTFAATVPMAGDPAALFARLRAASGAGYGALIDTGDRVILSLSPELFFALDGDGLICRPMKGTAARLPDPAADAAAAAALGADPKQRAENLMIVDLMRNDLSRVAVPGSVAVPALFAVEHYPTVHQMTSTVTATIAPGRDAVDVVAALFPCGSITGAPKSRAMAIIADVEDRARGVYCGAIGRIDAAIDAASGDAMFNVAIRTLTVRNGTATMGLGSGVVADSVAADEWDECLAKGAFLTAGTHRGFDLIETMAFDPQSGLQRLDLHLARLDASAAAFGFAFDRHAARNELQAATFRLRTPRRIRLLLARSGAIVVQVGAMPEPVAAMTIAVVPLPVAAGDFRLRHKTSDRGFYDAARRVAATDEVIFERPDGRLTEGSFTSLFVARGDGILVTPPLADGLLPGVLRADLIVGGRAVEGSLTRADLVPGGLFVGNALRGLVPAVPAVAP
ncbi:aminodeoxychorismate synthase component I [Sphingomonas bacterium]|uniref:aminodeoxychorismate synthase component I n=1 Tax=Sphingomonas bacterium TaxID=1895847 RepID=UPI0020C66F02|nr:aminodeoxychorismate synthase component I [Sphingomonas bacterium]